LIVHFHDKSLALPRLDPALDDLSILHLSDLHFTGRLGKEFFREVMRLAIESPPDLIAITGDFVDNAACIDWIPETLGLLTAPHGVYFVLGNHDPRMRQVPRLRQALTDAGFIDLAGRWLELEINGRPVVLAGNEMPWLPPAPDMTNCPTEFGGVRPLRLLLAHTPDQLAWARRHDFDLMLAGHTHGGQVCLPGIGPIFCPSRFGLKYAAGVFHEPPTVLHVSRGIAAETPSRWNCPPEVALLKLRAAGGK
jgi:predicted MPP superfamily phosphohydrolase